MTDQVPFTELAMTDNGNGTFTLDKPLTFVDTAQRRSFCVPAGFITDLSSIPQVFQNVISKVGSYDKAAVIHDYLYATQTTSRSVADRTLLDGMVALNVGWWTRMTIYRVVRIGGFIAWRSDAKKIVKQ